MRRTTERLSLQSRDGEPTGHGEVATQARARTGFLLVAFAAFSTAGLLTPGAAGAVDESCAALSERSAATGHRPERTTACGRTLTGGKAHARWQSPPRPLNRCPRRCWRQRQPRARPT